MVPRKMSLVIAYSSKTVSESTLGSSKIVSISETVAEDEMTERLTAPGYSTLRRTLLVSLITRTCALGQRQMSWYDVQTLATRVRYFKRWVLGVCRRVSGIVDYSRPPRKLTLPFATMFET